MTVIFNAKKAFGFLDVTPELKQRFELVFSKFAEKVSVAIANIMLNKNISFNRIQAFKSEVTDEILVKSKKQRKQPYKKTRYL